MERSKIFKGEDVQKALDEGLQELGLTLADVEYEIIEKGKKGFLGIGKKDAEVKITYSADEKEEIETGATSEAKKESVKEAQKTVKKTEKKPEKAKEPEKPAEKPKAETEAQEAGGEEQRAAEFINELLPHLGIEGKAVAAEGEEPQVNIETPTPYRIIGASSNRRGKKGDVLDAIQSLAGAYANKVNDKYKKVLVDCGGYRARRKAYLERLAGDLEKFAVERNRKVIAEPMSAYERRIIHTTLSKSDKVTTKSEGKDPDRYVVVIPNGVSSEERGIYYRPQGQGNRGGRPSGKGGGQRKEFNRDKQRPHGDARDSRGPARSSSNRGPKPKKEMHFNSVFLGNSGGSGDEDK